MPVETLRLSFSISKICGVTACVIQSERTDRDTPPIGDVSRWIEPTAAGKSRLATHLGG